MAKLLSVFTLTFAASTAFSTVDRWREATIVTDDQEQIELRRLPFKHAYSHPETEVHAVFTAFEIRDRDVNLVNRAGIKLLTYNAYPLNECEITIDVANAKDVEMHNVKEIIRKAVVALEDTMNRELKSYRCKVSYNAIPGSELHQLTKALPGVLPSTEVISTENGR